MSDRRYLIAALVCFLLGLWCASAMSQDFTALGGIGSSHRMGERSPFGVVYGELRGAHLALEAGWDSADKIETGEGWLAKGAVDFWFKGLSVGSGYTHRDGGPWSKDVWWVRAGVRSSEKQTFRLLAEIAPQSANEEMKLEARLRLRVRWFVIEYRGFVEHHMQGNGSGLALLVGGTFR